MLVRRSHFKNQCSEGWQRNKTEGIWFSEGLNGAELLCRPGMFTLDSYVRGKDKLMSSLATKLFSDLQVTAVSFACLFEERGREMGEGQRKSTKSELDITLRS